MKFHDGSIQLDIVKSGQTRILAVSKDLLLCAAHYPRGPTFVYYRYMNVRDG